MSCTQEEWIKLKFIEIGGMLGNLMRRIETLEKVVDKYLEDAKCSASNSEKLREKLHDREGIYGG